MGAAAATRAPTDAPGPRGAARGLTLFVVLFGASRDAPHLDGGAIPRPGCCGGIAHSHSFASQKSVFHTRVRASRIFVMTGMSILDSLQVT